MTPTVLVVEDEALIRMLLVDVLQDAGLHVLEAKDGREAEKRFGDTVACVLLDVRLPDADGLVLLDRFKARRPGCPILVMTGHGTPDVQARANALGADGFVHKPFVIDRLVDLVKAHARAATAG